MQDQKVLSNQSDEMTSNPGASGITGLGEQKATEKVKRFWAEIFGAELEGDLPASR